jgi:HEAT repeat protein
MLCDVIAAIAADHVDEVGRFISDARWYLVRNVVHVLGRLETPKGIAYLTQLMGHPEYRVRREVVEALVRIGTDDAEAQLIAFIDDFDERIRLKAVLSLSDAGVREAVPRLLGLLAGPDPWHRHYAVRREVIAALTRVRAKEALPALARIARRPIVFGSRSRGLRSLARDAIVRIESGGPPRGGPVPAMITDVGRL